MSKKHRSPRKPAEVSRRMIRWIAAALFFSAFALYLPSLWSGFVYDAQTQIVSTEYLHQPEHFLDVVTMRVLGQDVLDAPRPVHLFFLMVDASIWGRAPFGYHLTSNLLHAANTAGVFLLILACCAIKDRRTVAAAALGALVFAFHTVNVEAVAEVSYREDLLATFFLLAGLWMATRFGREGRRDWMYATGSVLAFLLAAGSKETGLAAPVLLFLYWLIFRREEGVRRWMPFLASAVVVVGAFAAARFGLAAKESQIVLFRPEYIGGSISGVWAVQPRLWAFLVKNIFWPHPLSGDYIPMNAGIISPAMAWMILATLGAAVGFLCWRSRLACLGTAFFCLGLAPVSNFMPLFRAVADRFLYLPMAGVAFLVAALILILPKRAGAWCAVGVAFCLIPLGILSVRREAVFASPMAFWKDTVQVSPRSSTAYEGLGLALVEEGKYGEALKVYDRGLQLAHGSKAGLWAGAAIALEKNDQPLSAEQACRKALELNPMLGDVKTIKNAMMMNGTELEAWEAILHRLGRPGEDNIR